jgi:hypothetical protein
MPDGNYDIFIIPPHSAGAGFLYLPSLAVQRNSFLAGVACALLAVGLYTIIVPAIKQWMNTIMASGGVGVLFLLIGVGVAGWAWGKTQWENNNGQGNAGGSAGSANTNQQQQNGSPPPRANGWAPPPPPPKPEPKPAPKPSAASGWEKAREETRKREEARKREEEVKKKAEDLRKAKEEAERAAKAKAEKDKWEQARAREKEQREREARERIAKERLAREKDTRERESREAASKSARSSPTKPTSSRYEKPTARSATEEEYSYRPYDKRPGYKSSASSISGLSESSFAPSQTTARTTPPPSHRGPYSTKDPDKIQIKAVYLFSDSFPMKPIASLISGQGHVTDGLILHIKTEGLFIDDDVRGVPQREWDVKAWTLKLVEDGVTKNLAGQGVHVLRATTRDAENKKYTFVLDETEAWKVAVGLARLRKGSQVRALGMSGMKENEVRGLLNSLGWM